MKYGFVIDNRKCIGCHACTVACKSEHDVPVGVNRTWVKQTEKGIFPHTRRVFSVLRCNHCTDAPCVDICPTGALFSREDGIVDFDNNRCIGCKSCMQACPYDALYIDPETNTAAKCNYCAHRVDINLEPACVNVCPEHAIISGDMDDPESEISQLLAREQVTVRKPEKATVPNVFYIDGDQASLNPSMTERDDQYIWSSQSTGVGHYAKYAADSIKRDSETMAAQLSAPNTAMTYANVEKPERSIAKIMKNGNAPRRVYDTPDKGILWGWEVTAYVLTKAVSAGVMLVLALAIIFGVRPDHHFTAVGTSVISLVFLGLTGLLLIKDLDQPKRFLFVLLRPQWSSWLVRGGYSISVFGAAVTAFLVFSIFFVPMFRMLSLIVSVIGAMVVATYTAFLFAQAKGRDFWQSPALAMHMLVHSIMAGSAGLMILGLAMGEAKEWFNFMAIVGGVAIVVNLLTLLVEMTITHPTKDAKRVVEMILRGPYRKQFWFGAVIIGNILPLVLLLTGEPIVLALAGVLILAGIFFTERIWVEAPQRIPLT